MKKLLLMAFVMLVAACDKEDNGMQEQPMKIVQISVADFPATRAEAFGKTAWEAGDELLLGYLGYSATNMLGAAAHSTHKLTFDGHVWTLDTPLVIDPKLDSHGIEVFYSPNRVLTLGNIADMDMHLCYLPNDLSGKVSDHTPYFLTEFLYANFLIEDETVVIDYSLAERDEMLLRSHRIRINYQQTEGVQLRVEMKNVTYPVAWFPVADVANYSVTTTTDEDGNAFIYLLWDNYSGASIQVYKGSSAVSKVISLPASGNDMGGKAFSLTIE